MIKQIDHIAIAVRDLAAAKAFFTDGLGGRQIWSAPMPGAGFRWTTIELGASCMIELINPEGEAAEVEAGFLKRFLDQRGEGAHHITIQVDDLAGVRDVLKERGISSFGFAEPLPGWKELFIHPKEAFGILIQFAEFNPFEWIAPGDPVPVPYQRFAPASDGSRSPVQAERVREKGAGWIRIRNATGEVRVAEDELQGLVADLMALGPAGESD